MCFNNSRIQGKDLVMGALAAICSKAVTLLLLNHCLLLLPLFVGVLSLILFVVQYTVSFFSSVECMSDECLTLIEFLLLCGRYCSVSSLRRYRLVCGL